MGFYYSIHLTKPRCQNGLITILVKHNWGSEQGIENTVVLYHFLDLFSFVPLQGGCHSNKSRHLWKLLDFWFLYLAILVSRGLNDYCFICKLFILKVKCQVHTGWNKGLFINMQTNASVHCQKYPNKPNRRQEIAPQLKGYRPATWPLQ